MTVFEAVFH